jgi:hypothetical protein
MVGGDGWVEERPASESRPYNCGAEIADLKIGHYIFRADWMAFSAKGAMTA